MCLICFSYQTSPAFRLILAANRDEFFNRPTLSLHRMGKDGQILAGRDLQQGGCWLGVNTSGKLAALTNYRDPQQYQPSAPSRGHLVLDYLETKSDSEKYIAAVRARNLPCNGYNLLLLDNNQLLYYSSVTGMCVALSPGIYALSNSFLDTPWPKVQRIKQLFSAVIAANPEDLDDSLLHILRDTYRPHDMDLPTTGVGIEWERKLSSIFIAEEEYGTRSSSVVSCFADGRITFTEKVFFDPHNSSNSHRTTLGIPV